jgi:hypothetical protein
MIELSKNGSGRKDEQRCGKYFGLENEGKLATPIMTFAFLSTCYLFYENVHS